MTQCGIDCWGKSIEKRSVFDYRFLAILTSECRFGNIAYISYRMVYKVTSKVRLKSNP